MYRIPNFGVLHIAARLGAGLLGVADEHRTDQALIGGKTTKPRIKALRFGIVLVVLLGLGSAKGEATWTQGGITWNVSPSGSSVGGCFGNCGGGCSDSWNICGGPTQYWDMAFTAGPDLQGVVDDYECYGGIYYVRHWEMYYAIGRWTYHRWVKPGCVTHDVYCSPWNIACLAFFGCGSPGSSDTWSYDEWMVGYKDVGLEFEGSPC